MNPDYTNHLLSTLAAAVLGLSVWVFNTNAKIAVLESNEARIEKVIEANTKTNATLATAISVLSAQIKHSIKEKKSNGN